MHYVKHFKINGVDTKQVACIELQGAPNAATEGAIGVLGMDMLSPTHEVYRCVAVNGSVYTWELLSAGMSIINATITGEGGEVKSFPYAKLNLPDKYLIKVGDLILDSEGYLYKVNAISAESCDTVYCGTHIGGISSGDRDFRLFLNNGKLLLVTESGAIVSSIDYLLPDNTTLHRNSSTGKTSVIGVTTINGELLRFFVGDQETYDTLTEEQKKNLFAIIKDDKTKEVILAAITELQTNYGALKESLADGSLVVAKATHATEADHAAKADMAIYATNTDNARIADNARNADHATSADSATHATEADHATNADSADEANNADRASYAIVAKRLTEAAPYLNTDKRLSEGGYHYIYCYRTDIEEYIHFGLVYFFGYPCEMNAVANTNKYRLEIDVTGALSLIFINETGAESDVSNSAEFYTAKLGT